MGTVVFILGRSGTGKSYSMKGFDPEKIGVINVQGKILPFREGREFLTADTDDPTQILQALEVMAKSRKTIVIDDFQYLMGNEFMRRSYERGYDKFTEIARHAWDVVDKVRTLPNDVIVYIMCHTDTDADGLERLKTIGKMLDEKIVLEGMATIVLKTNVSDGQYTFLTQNNGKDTVKSPAGMFPSYAIENNLKYVDEKIRNYYGIGEFLSDDEIKEIDATAAKLDVIKEPGARRRGRRKAETADNAPETPVNAPETATTTTDDKTPAETTDAPKRRRRRVETADVTPEVKPDVTTQDETTQDEPPRRRRRAAAETPETPETTATDEPPRRRRRRTAETETVTDLVKEEFMNDNDDLPFEIN